jgi:hypothetical protein
MPSAIKALDHSFGAFGLWERNAVTTWANGESKTRSRTLSQHEPSPSVHPFDQNADTRGNESRTRERCPKQTTRQPSRHQAGNEPQKNKMINAKNHGRHSEEVRASRDEHVESIPSRSVGLRI